MVRIGKMSGGNYFKGPIAELRIWNTARSGGDIQANMLRRLNGDEPDLAGYWRFEGGVARDYSGKGNDGTTKGP